MHKNNLLKKVIVGAVVTMPLTTSMLQVLADDTGAEALDDLSSLTTNGENASQEENEGQNLSNEVANEETTETADGVTDTTTVGGQQDQGDAKQGSVKILVVDNDGKSVVGAVVELLNSKDESRGPVNTNESGHAIFTDLVVDETYTAKLVAVPEGYEVNANSTEEITVGNTEGEVSGRISIEKVQPETNSSPQEPESNESKESESGEPKDPESGEPKDPESGEPKDPESGEPKDPESGEPKDPESGEPKDPESSEPEDSDEGDDDKGSVKPVAKTEVKKENGKELPNTGEAVGMTALIAGLLGAAGLGTLFINRRRKNK